MKRFISLLMAALMLVSVLAGCGGGSNQGGEDVDGVRTVTLRNTAALSSNDPHATTN